MSIAESVTETNVGDTAGEQLVSFEPGALPYVVHESAAALVAIAIEAKRRRDSAGAAKILPLSATPDEAGNLALDDSDVMDALEGLHGMYETYVRMRGPTTQRVQNINRVSLALAITISFQNQRGLRDGIGLRVGLNPSV